MASIIRPDRCSADVGRILVVFELAMERRCSRRRGHVIEFRSCLIGPLLNKINYQVGIFMGIRGNRSARESALAGGECSEELWKASSASECVIRTIIGPRSIRYYVDVSARGGKNFIRFERDRTYRESLEC